MSTNAEPQDLRERPIGDLAKDLMSDVSLLVRQEIHLAKAEMREKGRVALPGVGMLGGATVVAMCAAGALTAFLVLVLAEAMDAWLAALIVGVVLGGVAAALVWAGKERVEEAGKPLPEKTIESVEEDVEWVKHQAKSGRR